jgi:hypothetical protein
MAWARSSKKIRWRICRLPLISRALVLFVALLFAQAGLFGTRSEAGPPFTIEILSESGGTPGVRAKGKGIVITEPVSLPTPCHQVDGAVQLQAFQIDVRLKPKPNPTPGMMCAQVVVQRLVRITIPDLPAGAYSVRVQTPDRIATSTVTIG